MKSCSANIRSISIGSDRSSPGQASMKRDREKWNFSVSQDRAGRTRIPSSNVRNYPILLVYILRALLSRLVCYVYLRAHTPNGRKRARRRAFP